jgi:hypothetical protein
MGIPTPRAIHESVRAALPRSVVQYSRVIRLVAFASIATSPLWLVALFFTSPQDYSYASSLICVPLLAVVCAVVIAHFTQGDPYLRRLSMASLVAHMAASSFFLWVGIAVYGGVADTFHYWTVGVGIAKTFPIVGWSVFQPPYWSTNLIFNLCGLAALLIGDALPALFIASSFISLAGGYLFYRAFVIAFPDGDRWLFGLLVMFMPSILFWSSFIGKDAPIQFFIGLTCFGFARLTQRPGPRSVLFCTLGLGGALLIRAHVAAMLALAMTFAYVAGKPKTGSGNKAAKLILIPILLAGSYFLVSQAKNLVDSQSDNANSSNVVQEANTLTKFSQTGGSSFNEGVSLPVRIAESPFLIFRPFPWEMHSSMAVASAVESLGLLFLCWRRRREIWSTLRQWRNPYTSFIVMYALIFLVTFGGAISNLGTLLRQRIMMTPVVLMLICAKQISLVRKTSQQSREDAWLTSYAARLRSDRVPAGD